MTRIIFAAAVLAGAAFPTPGRAQHPYVPSPFGAEVLVQTPEGELLGELIAVTEDRMWLLDDETLHVLPLASTVVRIRRFDASPSAAWTWGILGGIGTGLAMYGACASVTEDCGGVFIGMLAPYLGWGWAGAATLAGSRTATIPHYPESLRPYARFPQGLPPGVDEAALRPPR